MKAESTIKREMSKLTTIIQAPGVTDDTANRCWGAREALRWALSDERFRPISAEFKSEVSDVQE